MKVFIETDRLILRELLPSDAKGMFELDSDAEVHRFLGNHPIQNLRQAEEIIETVRSQYIKNGIGRWAIIEKSSGDFLGWTGLKLVEEEINGRKNYHDLGYRLLRKYWGKGFATESAIASLQYGFETLELEQIVGAAHIENKASNRILNKLGFEWKNTFEYDGATHNWYELKRKDWLG
jgi:RimJ/RimL family protein N-acetyltransferase